MSDVFLIISFLSHALALVVLVSLLISLPIVGAFEKYTSFSKDVLFPTLSLGIVPALEIVLVWNYSIHAPLTVSGLILVHLYRKAGKLAQCIAHNSTQEV